MDWIGALLMARTIQSPAIEYDFGLDFDYAVWTPGTTIDLVNVPWANDYRDVVKFGSRDLLDAYIDGLRPAGIKVERMSYVKPNEPVRIDIPFNRAIKYNYLRASNPLQPIAPTDEKRNFYYFILDVRYVAPNTTELVLQLDVWQTYIFDVRLGRCWVERGHIGIANENNWHNYGRDYLTTPEGLDFGGEYRHVYQKRTNMYDFAGDTEGTGDADILVVSTVDLTRDPGTVANPKLYTASGQDAFGLVTGANMYVFKGMSDFKVFMQHFSDKPWVTQGIISITPIPSVKRYNPSFTYPSDIPGLPSGAVGSKAPVQQGIKIFKDVLKNWRDNLVFKTAISDRYFHLKKFFTYPYMVIELTTYNGNVLILKPESWHNANARIGEIPCLFPPNQRIVFYPVDYNANVDNAGETSDYINVATMINNFPTLPIVNDGAIGWMAANKNMIQWQRNSADWAQQRALGSAQAGYDIATQGIETNQNLAEIAKLGVAGNTAIGNMLNAQQGMVGMFTDAAGGAAFGATGGIAGGVGAIGLGVNTLNQIDAANMSANLQKNMIGANVGIGNRQQAFIRDTNMDLARWASRGDYANTIAGINAKVQDAQLIPPSVSGQFGGEAFTLSQQLSGYAVKWKMIDNAAIRNIGEFWLRYGYAVRASIALPTSLMAMTNFTYWKLAETYITSALVPEGFKQAIRGIFEKGVTVWARPQDIGNIDWANNAPLAGIKY